MRYTPNIFTNPSYLEHHGVKGMRWGVRRTKTGNVRALSTMSRRQSKQLNAMTSNQDRNEKFTKEYNRIFRKSAPAIRKSIRAINRKPEYRQADFHKDGPIRQKYYKEISNSFSTHLNANSKPSILRPFQSVQMRFTMDVGGNTTSSLVPKVTLDGRSNSTENAANKQASKDLLNQQKMQHGVDFTGDSVDIEVELIMDANGFVTDFGEEDQETLQHHGVLGMKWGVRRGRNATSKIRTGKNAKSMTNDQLSSAIRRIELERRYTTLTTKEKSAASKFVGNVVKNAASQVATEFVKSEMTKQVKKYLD